VGALAAHDAVVDPPDDQRRATDAAGQLTEVGSEHAAERAQVPFDVGGVVRVIAGEGVAPRIFLDEIGASPEDPTEGERPGAVGHLGGKRRQPGAGNELDAATDPRRWSAGAGRIDEHEPLDFVGVAHGELGPDLTAHRVADHVDPSDHPQGPANLP